MSAIPTGKKIARIAFVDNARDSEFHIVFEDGQGYRVWDDMRSCCENRYVRTDDDLDSVVGAVFLGIEARSMGDAKDDYDTHEQTALLITTSVGVLTLVSHNVHNGYYGGIDPMAQLLEQTT